MKYYSTNQNVQPVKLEEAVIKGLANDKGLFMPERIRTMEQSTIQNLKNMTFHEIACTVARAFFDEDMDGEVLDAIVKDTLSFDTPVVPVKENIYSLELFHGPTLAFKDVGGRFMARLLGHFIKKEGLKQVNVLAATSGDTGSAVANGFLGVPGIHVYVLYPKGKVSPIQECQFTTLGQNITALEIDGTFDDCQALVKDAFMDTELNEAKMLTSANSINIARLLPQSFYYFNAYAQLDRMGKADNMVVSVPCGNFGNITAGLIARVMGLPIKRFIAANNRNDVFLKYLQSGEYHPAETIQTIANAMDVGNPSNFARVIDLYKEGDTHQQLCSFISGASFTDEEIASAIQKTYAETKYILDPHGACAYQALAESIAPDENGVFLETAHPAKFKGTIDHILNDDIVIPDRLKAFMQGKKQSIALSKEFADFKKYLLQQP